MRQLIGGEHGGTEAKADGQGDAVALRLVTEADCGELLRQLPEPQRRWAQGQGFTGQRHRLLMLPRADGSFAAALWGLGELDSAAQLTVWDAAPLAERLPGGLYELHTTLPA